MSDQKAVGELLDTVYSDLGPVGGVVCNAGEWSGGLEPGGGS